MFILKPVVLLAIFEVLLVNGIALPKPDAAGIDGDFFKREGEALAHPVKRNAQFGKAGQSSRQGGGGSGSGPNGAPGSSNGKSNGQGGGSWDGAADSITESSQGYSVYKKRDGAKVEGVIIMRDGEQRVGHANSEVDSNNPQRIQQDRHMDQVIGYESGKRDVPRRMRGGYGKRAAQWDATPSGSWEATPTGSWESTPSGSWEATPTGSWEATPSGSWEATPSGSWEATPSGSWEVGYKKRAA